MPRDDDEDDDRPRRRRPRRDDENDDDDDDDDRPRQRRSRDEDEEDDAEDRPRKRRPAPASNGMATTSLVLGVLSLCGGCVTGVPAIITGFMGLSKANKTGVGKGMALAGLLTGAFGTLVVTGVGAYFGNLIVKESADTVTDTLNGKQTILSVHNFSDANGFLPNPYGPKPGQPMGGPPGLSWRVDLLPYLEQRTLYGQFDPSQPWNGAKNQPLANTVVKPYHFSYDADTDPKTRWRGFTGKNDGRGGPVFAQGNRVVMQSIVDGTSNTLFCFEAADPAGWTEPNEFPFGPGTPMPAYGGRATRPAQFLMMDGSVRMIAKGKLDDATFRAIVTKDGGEVVIVP